jgi:hypothetical protein
MLENLDSLCLPKPASISDKVSGNAKINVVLSPVEFGTFDEVHENVIFLVLDT